MTDILILNKQFIQQQMIPLKKILFVELQLHHMYEFLEDASKALGKQISFIIDSLNNLHLTEYLKAVRKSFNKLKKEYHEPLKLLRHNVSGHKDRDIRNQVAISKDINLVEFQKNFVLFLLFFIELTIFKRAIIDEINKQQKFSDESSNKEEYLDNS